MECVHDGRNRLDFEYRNMKSTCKIPSALSLCLSLMYLASPDSSVLPVPLLSLVFPKILSLSIALFLFLFISLFPSLLHSQFFSFFVSCSSSCASSYSFPLSSLTFSQCFSALRVSNRLFSRRSSVREPSQTRSAWDGSRGI